MNALIPLLAVMLATLPLSAGPLKVFILAGQSNMQGHARVETFDYIGDNPVTAPLLAEMRDPAGQPRVLDQVWISSIGMPGGCLFRSHRKDREADRRIRRPG
jgi:alpha-galactosidase